MELGLEMAGLPGKARRRRAAHLLELVGLAEVGQSCPGSCPEACASCWRWDGRRSEAAGILFSGALDALTRIRLEEELVRSRLHRLKTVAFVTSSSGPGRRPSPPSPWDGTGSQVPPPAPQPPVPPAGHGDLPGRPRRGETGAYPVLCRSVFREGWAPSSSNRTPATGLAAAGGEGR